MQCKGCSGSLCGGGHLYIILSNAWTGCFHVKLETLDDLCHDLPIIYTVFPIRKCLSHTGIHINGGSRVLGNSYCHLAKTCCQKSFHLTRSKLFKVHIHLHSRSNTNTLLNIDALGCTPEACACPV